MRGRSVEGIILTTFTPLKGITTLVNEFLNAADERQKGRSIDVVICGMDDVPHLTEKEKSEMLAGVPAWQRKSRRTGYPSVEAGLIYPVDEEQFVITPIPLPKHWRRVSGFDHGILNTAAGWFAHDPDNDVFYLYSEYKRGGDGITKEMHAAAFLARGPWIPMVGDCAARDSDMGPVFNQYRALGVKMHKADKSSGSVTSGIDEVLSRLVNGKLKVFSTCQKWLEEFRKYRREKKETDVGERLVIVKKDDHLMDMTRYVVVDGVKLAAIERQQKQPAPQEELTFGLY
jgi:hypothetical protein